MLGYTGRKFVSSGSTAVRLKKICKGAAVNGTFKGSFQIWSRYYFLVKFLCIHAYLPSYHLYSIAEPGKKQELCSPRTAFCPLKLPRTLNFGRNAPVFNGSGCKIQDISKN